MEEDIKILESFLDVDKQLMEDYGQNATIKQEQIKSLENLLTRYKQMAIENQSYKDYYGEPPAYENAKYIPKSKIKEKIEELNKEKEETYTKFLESDRSNETLSTKGKMIQGAIEVLQELLEEE